MHLGKKNFGTCFGSETVDSDRWPFRVSYGAEPRYLHLRSAREKKKSLGIHRYYLDNFILDF